MEDMCQRAAHAGQRASTRVRLVLIRPPPAVAARLARNKRAVVFLVVNYVADADATAAAAAATAAMLCPRAFNRFVHTKVSGPVHLVPHVVGRRPATIVHDQPRAKAGVDGGGSCV